MEIDVGKGEDGRESESEIRTTVADSVETTSEGISESCLQMYTLYICQVLNPGKSPNARIFGCSRQPFCSWR